MSDIGMVDMGKIGMTFMFEPIMGYKLTERLKKKSGQYFYNP